MNNEIRNEGKLVSPTNPFPISDVNLSVDKQAITTETVTFVGKAVAGSVGSNSLGNKPILNLRGDKVGSYWGKSQNEVWETDGSDIKLGKVGVLVETNGSADVVIRTGKHNLEKLFESSGSGRYIIRVWDDGGNSLYGWIGGVAASATDYTFDVYSEVGLSNQNWVGTLTDFDGTPVKARIYAYDTSFEWVTGTVLTKEVGYNSQISDIKNQAGFSDGEYAIDYLNGRILYQRASTGTSDTCGYTTTKKDYTTPEALISSAQDFTGSWVDLGTKIDMRGYKDLLVYLDIDINDAIDTRVRALGDHDTNGTNEFVFPIESISASQINIQDEFMEFAVDANQKVVLRVKAQGVPYLQLQISAGTAGATAGQIDSAYINKTK